MVAYARRVGWGRSEEVTSLYLVLWRSTPTYRVKTHDSMYSCFTPLMKFSIHTADNSLLPLLFLRSMSILSGCPTINICSCHQDMKLSWIGPIADHPHTRLHYCKFLAYLSHVYGRFSNIWGNDLDVNGIEKCLFFMEIRHMVILFEF
jgi:hypothetical protein